MKLVRDEIVTNCAYSAAAFCAFANVTLEELFNTPHCLATLPPAQLSAYPQALDFAVTAHVARKAQTFIFAHQQILAFVNAIDRKLPPGDYPAPFPYMIIQFDKGIDEHLLTTGLNVSGGTEENDEILAMILATGTLLSAAGEIESTIINVIAWYKSTAVNRVAIDLRGDGTLETAMMLITDSERPNQELLLKDKQRLVNLTMLCLAYIHSPGIVTEHVTVDAAINRHRVAKGKRELPEYYICHVRHERQAPHASGTSSRQVSFRFDVQGHFRRLTDGRTIWIKAHQRGIEHELYKPKIYRVDYKEEQP